MAKAAKGAKTPPKRNSGRTSVKQAEVREGLEMLKAGQGEKVTDEKGREFLVVELDGEKVETVEKAQAALYNLRWALNPVNKVTGGDEDEFNRLFGTAGHGGLKVYGEDERILIAASADYATGKAKPSTPRKPATRKPAAKSTAKRATVKKATPAPEPETPASE